MFLIWRQILVSRFESAKLFWCRHFATASLLLLSISRPSCSAIANFSVRHNRQRLELGLYGCALRRIFHFTVGVPPLSLILQISLLNSVSLISFLSLNDFLCSLNLSFQGRLVIPLYVLISHRGRSDVTVDSYRTPSLRQFPLRGHSLGRLQFHVRPSASFFSLRIFLLWPFSYHDQFECNFTPPPIKNRVKQTRVKQ